jgi:heme exporter protein D
VRRRGAEGGYALLLALAVTALTLAAGTLVVLALVLRMELLQERERDLRLTALLDAAMARTLSEVALNPDYGGTEGVEPFAGGIYAITAERVGSNRVSVRVRAVYADVGRGGEAEITLRPRLRVTFWRVVPHDPRRR